MSRAVPRPAPVSIDDYLDGETVRHETFTEGSFRMDCLDAEVTLDEVYMDAEAL